MPQKCFPKQACNKNKNLVWGLDADHLPDGPGTPKHPKSKIEKSAPGGGFVLSGRLTQGVESHRSPKSSCWKKCLHFSIFDQKTKLLQRPYLPFPCVRIAQSHFRLPREVPNIFPRIWTPPWGDTAEETKYIVWNLVVWVPMLQMDRSEYWHLGTVFLQNCNGLL